MWTDNLQAYTLFHYMSTQWRTSGGGPTGLDYATLHHKMDRMKLDPEEYEQLENDVRTMEIAALTCMHAKH